MNDDTYQLMAELLAAQAAGENLVLATIVAERGSVPRHVGSKMLIYGNGKTSGSVGGGEMEARVLQEAPDVLDTGKARMLNYRLVDPGSGDPGLCGGEVDIFLEPYLQLATLFIVGCGHVGRALAAQAHLLGYRVVVTDDRVDLAAPENIPDADQYLPGDIETALEEFSITSNTYIALVTRNVLLDREILPKLVATPAPYIGVMGSHRRWLETRKLLLADGLKESDLSRFHSPLGLELNAETPEEIAVSIIAEIIMLRRGGSGERMKA